MERLVSIFFLCALMKVTFCAFCFLIREQTKCYVHHDLGVHSWRVHRSGKPEGAWGCGGGKGEIGVGGPKSRFDGAIFEEHVWSQNLFLVQGDVRESGAGRFWRRY